MRWVGIPWLLATLCLSSASWAGASGSNAGEVELTREGKASIQMALQYLASHQRADGSLSGAMGNTTGIVAAACMAWMVNGNLPGEGPYGKNVAKGLDYILSCAQSSGFLYKGRDGGSMYHHGLATICLAEAWGHTRDKRLYDKLKRAIELIVHCQNDKGGWRYQPKITDDDLSVVVMQLLALRAAKDAGMAVPKEVIDNAIGYVGKCHSPKDNDNMSGFSYQPGGPKTWSTTAAGVMSLMLCGNYKANELKDSLNYILRCREKKEDKTFFIYGHYYAAQAMYQAGGQGEKYLQYWQKWYPDISRFIVSKQLASGGERGRYLFGGGFTYTDDFGAWSTAMCVLVLGIPYRYLPIYQR